MRRKWSNDSSQIFLTVRSSWIFQKMLRKKLKNDALSRNGKKVKDRAKKKKIVEFFRIDDFLYLSKNIKKKVKKWWNTIDLCLDPLKNIENRKMMIDLCLDLSKDRRIESIIIGYLSASDQKKMIDVKFFQGWHVAWFLRIIPDSIFKSIPLINPRKSKSLSNFADV